MDVYKDGFGYRNFIYVAHFFENSNYNKAKKINIYYVSAWIKKSFDSVFESMQRCSLFQRWGEMEANGLLWWSLKGAPGRKTLVVAEMKQLETWTKISGGNGVEVGHTNETEQEPGQRLIGSQKVTQKMIGPVWWWQSYVWQWCKE